MRADQPLDRTDPASLALSSREPSPDEGIALADELESVLARLEPFERRVMELRLRGERLEAIADQTDRSERTVRRALETIRRLLGQRLERPDES